MPGKDVFLSYASEDGERLHPLVEALERAGFAVFWARRIRAGQRWSEVLEAEIETCRSVVVVWSQRSVGSEYVKEEAEVGRGRGILLPVLIDRVDPPLGYRQIQAADLVDWDGDASATPFLRLVRDLASLVGARRADAEERVPDEPDTTGAVQPENPRRTSETDQNVRGVLEAFGGFRSALGLGGQRWKIEFSDADETEATATVEFQQEGSILTGTVKSDVDERSWFAAGVCRDRRICYVYTSTDPNVATFGAVLARLNDAGDEMSGHWMGYDTAGEFTSTRPVALRKLA